MEPSLSEFLGRDYPYTMMPSCMGGGYVICFPDLYGFSIHAASLEQAKADIEQAKKEWYEAAVKEGRPIPLPYEYIKREA